MVKEKGMEKLQEKIQSMEGKITRLERRDLVRCNRIDRLERTQKVLKKILHKKPHGIAPGKLYDIFKYIEERETIYKDKLIEKFPLLSNHTYFKQTKDFLEGLGEIRYLWFSGKGHKARFIFIGDNDSMVAKSLDCFEEVDWDENIAGEFWYNNKIAVSKTLLRILPDLVIQGGPLSSTPLKKSRKKRRGRRRR